MRDLEYFALGSSLTPPKPKPRNRLIDCAVLVTFITLTLAIFVF